MGTLTLSTHAICQAFNEMKLDIYVHTLHTVDTNQCH